MPPAPEPLYTPIEKPEPLDISVTAEPVIENQIIPSPLNSLKTKMRSHRRLQKSGIIRLTG